MLKSNRFDRRLPSIFSRLLLLLCAGFFAVGTAQAGSILPGQYQLLDHPDGAINPPPYGLRVDSLGYTFSVELGGANVILDWDGGSTATITGSLWNNQNSELWDVAYTLTGVVAEPADFGFTATAGSGFLTDPSLVATAMTGKADDTGKVFVLFADGDRLGSYPAYPSDTAVGRGWIEPPDSTNDWLVVAVPIPEPGTAMLLGMGLLALGARRRA